MEGQKYHPPVMGEGRPGKPAALRDRSPAEGRSSLKHVAGNRCNIHPENMSDSGPQQSIISPPSPPPPPLSTMRCFVGRMLPSGRPRTISWSRSFRGKPLAVAPRRGLG